MCSLAFEGQCSSIHSSPRHQEISTSLFEHLFLGLLVFSKLAKTDRQLVALPIQDSDPLALVRFVQRFFKFVRILQKGSIAFIELILVFVCSVFEDLVIVSFDMCADCPGGGRIEHVFDMP